METTETLEITTPKSAKTIYFGLLSIYVFMFILGALLHIFRYTNYSNYVENKATSIIELFFVVYYLKPILFPILIYYFYKTIRFKEQNTSEFNSLVFYFGLFMPIANIKRGYIITRHTLLTIWGEGLLTWIIPFFVRINLILLQFSFLYVISDWIKIFIGDKKYIINHLASIIEILFNLSGLIIAYLSYRFIKTMDQI